MNSLLQKTTSYTILLIICWFASSSYGAEEREEVANLELTVFRGEKSMPIHRVPKLLPGDTLQVSFADSVGDVGFNTTGFKELIVLFAPGNSAQIPAMRTDPFAVHRRKLKLQPGIENDSVCFKNCRFFVPSSYNSFPVLFLVSDSGYSRDLRDLVKQEHSRFKDLGTRTVNLSIAARTVNFLLEMSRLFESKAAANPKVIQSLYDKATKKFQMFTGNDCATQGITDDLSWDQKTEKQLRCLLRQNQGLIEKAKGLIEKGQSINVKEIAFFFAEEAIAQLLRKFPSMSLYFDIAKVVIQLVAAFFAKPALNITSGFIDRASKKSNIFTLFKNPPASNDERTNTPATAERALFFVPLGWRTHLHSLEEMTKAPTPIAPCLAPGGNLLGTSYDISSDPTVLARIKLENPANSGDVILLEDYEVSDANESLRISITDDQWRRLSTWQKVNGRIILDYNFGEFTSSMFEYQLPSNIDLGPSSVSTVNFRKGIKTPALRLSRELPNCIEKVVLKFGDEEEIRATEFSPTEIKFRQTEIDSVPITTGVLRIYQTANDSPAEIPVKLRDFLPRVTNLRIGEGDSAGIIEGDRLDQLASSGHSMISHESRIATEKPLLFSRKDQTIRFATASESAPPAGTKISLRLKLETGEEIDSEQTFTVSKRRPAFLRNSTCGKADGEVPIAVKAVMPEIFPFEFENCVGPTAIEKLKVTLKAETGKFRFRRDAKYKILVKSTNTIEDAPTDEGAEIFNDQTTPRNAELALEIPIDGNIYGRPLDEDGVRLRIKLVDAVLGASNWYTLGYSFVRLPETLTLDCFKEGDNPCELSGDLDLVEEVSVKTDSSGKPIDWNDVEIASDFIRLPMLSVTRTNVADPPYFFIKVAGDDRPIKVKQVPGFENVVFKIPSF